jgi:hypothetical protein
VQRPVSRTCTPRWRPHSADIRRQLNDSAARGNGPGVAAATTRLAGTPGRARAGRWPGAGRALAGRGPGAGRARAGLFRRVGGLEAGGDGRVRQGEQGHVEAQRRVPRNQARVPRPPVPQLRRDHEPAAAAAAAAAAAVQPVSVRGTCGKEAGLAADAGCKGSVSLGCNHSRA